jgi:hypothetical protein
MCEMNVPPELVRRIMRHSSLATTMKHYVGLDDNDLFRAVKHIQLRREA